jgi:hypothetical protein
MVTVISANWAVLTQIGDGDMLAVLPDGQALSPVPDDPNLDGRRTTSLCQVGAVDSFRVATIDLTDSQLFAVLSGTDGFGNAQAQEQWQPGVAADLVRFTIDSGPDWISASLPGWAKQCASSAGSGDDCTVALVVNNDAQLSVPVHLPPLSQSDPAGLAKTVRLTPTIPFSPADGAGQVPGSGEAITVPVPKPAQAGSWLGAAPATQRLAQPLPPGPALPGPQLPGPPPRPARPASQQPQRRMRLLAAVAVVVVVAAVVGSALALHGSPAKKRPPRPSNTPTPSVTAPHSSKATGHHHKTGGAGGGGVGGGSSASPSPSNKGHTVSFSVTISA